MFDGCEDYTRQYSMLSDGIHIVTAEEIRDHLDDHPSGVGDGDMLKSVYDTDDDGTVDDSEKLEGNTLSQVRDHTPKAHTHVQSEITDLENLLVDTIQFDTSLSPPSHNEGLIFWDQNYKTVAMYNDEADVTLQVGQEQWLRVYNNTVSTILNGSVVYMSGVTGTDPTIALAKADDASTSLALGLATHDIEASTYGYITTFGLVHGLNTSSFSNGEAVYLSATTAGALTNTKPFAPNWIIEIGRVVYSDASNGKILVNVLGNLSSTHMHVIEVAKQGGDFTTIQGAIDSITDASSTNRYLVLVYPGVYTENVTGKDYVDIHGICNRNTIIRSSSGVTYTFPTNSDTHIHKIVLETTSGYLINVPSGGTQTSCVCECALKATLTNEASQLVVIGGGVFEIRNCLIEYTMTGTATSGRHDIFHPNGGSEFHMYGCMIDMNIDDDSAINQGVIEEDITYTVESHIHQNIIRVNLTNASYSGSAGFYYPHGAGAQKFVQNNYISIQGNGGGTGYCYFQNTTSNDGIIASINNLIFVEGFSSNYFCFNSTGDQTDSSFDVITAADEATGVGTASYASSFAGGSYFKVGDPAGASQITMLEIWNTGASWTLADRAYFKATTTGTGDVFGAGIELDSNSATNGRAYIIVSTAELDDDNIGGGKLGFWDVNSTTYRMVMDSNGYFAIGTAHVNPAERLDVLGNIKVSGYLTDGTRNVTVEDMDGLVINTGYAESNGISSTTSSAYQQKLRLTFTPPVAGTYLLTMTCSYSVGAANAIDLQLEQDDTTVIWGNYTFGGVGVADAIPCSASAQITFADTNAHTFDLDYSSDDGVGTVYIREARISIRRFE